MKKLAFFLPCLFAFCFIANSCKNNSDYVTPQSKINSLANRQNYGTVATLDILHWFDNHPQVTPAGILIGQASQATINGQQIIRIPVANNAALYFTKVNDSLKVYAYKWIYSGTPTANYTGMIDVYNFQDQNLKRMVYTNGKLNKVLLLSAGSSQSKISSSGKQVNYIPILSQVWCWITGGTWVSVNDNSSGGGAGEAFTPGCNYGADDGDDDGGAFTYITIYVDDSGDVYSDVAGTGGGQQWGPPPCPPDDGGAGTNTVKKQINSITGKKVNVAAPGGGSGCPTAPDGSQWMPVSLVKYNLSSAQQQWLYNNPGFFEAFFDYINDNPDWSDQDAADFLNSMINYCLANPSESVSLVQNYFMTEPEGLDGPDVFDQNYWNDPNLQVQQQSLPSYQDFFNNFPNVDAPAVYTLIGGQILAHHQSDPANYSNACALRVSRALNYSGITIPALRGTETGSDGKNYFLSAQNLNAWMRKTFGPPTDHFTKAQGGTNGENFPSLIDGKKGIYSMVASGWVATGHADLFNGRYCDRGCDITKYTQTIDIWELQ